MKQAKPTAPQAKRGVGLDKPCKVCGQAIYFNYRGPMEGVCGRCTDRMVAKHAQRPRSRTVVVERRAGAGRRIAILLVFAAGAAAALLLRDMLPF